MNNNSRIRETIIGKNFMSEIIKVEHLTNHIVEVLINRPENYNTFNTELRLSLAENLRKIDQNKDTLSLIHI